MWIKLASPDGKRCWLNLNEVEAVLWNAGVPDSTDAKLHGPGLVIRYRDKRYVVISHPDAVAELEAVVDELAGEQRIKVPADTDAVDPSQVWR